MVGKFSASYQTIRIAKRAKIKEIAKGFVAAVERQFAKNCKFYKNSKCGERFKWWN